MPITSYPNGFSQGVSVRGMPLLNAYAGNIYWVDSVYGGNDGTYDSPFTTITLALARCVANRGDIIVCKAGHSETITAAAGIAIATAGVAIIGLGTGTNRPKLTFSTANTASITVSAANVSIMNFQFLANFLSIAAPITLTTAAEFSISNCMFKDNSGILNFLQCVRSTGAANTIDGLNFVNNEWASLGTTSVGSAVLSANDVDRMVFSGNKIVQNTTVDASICVTITAGVVTNFWAEGNRGYRKNTTTTPGSLINVGGSTSTGFVVNNYMQTLTTTADKLFTTTAGLGAFENRVSGVVGAQGFVIPAADA